MKHKPFLQFNQNHKSGEWCISVCEMRDEHCKTLEGSDVVVPILRHIVPCIGSGKTKVIAKRKAKMYLNRLTTQLRHLS